MREVRHKGARTGDDVRNYKRETLRHSKRITPYIVVEELDAAVVRSNIDETVGSEMDDLSAGYIEVRPGC